jgi:hypothetical protein
MTACANAEAFLHTLLVSVAEVNLVEEGSAAGMGHERVCPSEGRRHLDAAVVDEASGWADGRSL